ncbi:DUF3618 domain-containing protein [Plantactinospora endophytica]|uniref:DUF3618 domain-containing protein n=1 Tax=Plantactinospora endophytica TaxID=673535 RepID=A0ABQ4DUA3_9ACTN|nr:DUF3618 domain-containing protein [Plantactinospora endophytica]GIG86033.1 hypothetical protein Pen02_09690 [Plantactinospora endophytica]
MTSDPSQIRADINRTQDTLGANMNALGDRMNPRNAANRQAGKVRGGWQRIRENVMGSTAHARDNVMGARDNVMGTAQHARETSQARLAGAGNRLQSMGQQARQQPEGHPLAAGLIAFGLGVIASALLPASDPERRMAGRLRDEFSEHSGQLKQQATGAAQQAREHLREPVQQATESVRSKAGQQAGGMREQARSSAQELRGQAQEKAGEARRR